MTRALSVTVSWRLVGTFINASKPAASTIGTAASTNAELMKTECTPIDVRCGAFRQTGAAKIRTDEFQRATERDGRRLSIDAHH